MSCYKWQVNTGDKVCYHQFTAQYLVKVEMETHVMGNKYTYDYNTDKCDSHIFPLNEGGDLIVHYSYSTDNIVYINFSYSNNKRFLLHSKRVIP